MSEKEARVLAAGDTIEVIVDGKPKEYKIAPVGMRQLHEVQRAAVRYFKREYLATYAGNIDMMPDKRKAEQLLERKMDEVGRWDIGNLPVKTAYFVALVPTDGEKLKAFLEDEFDDVPEDENQRRSLLAAALDSGLLSCEDAERLTGVRPKKVRIPYDSWWISSVREGMIEFVLVSIRQNHPDVSRDEIESWPVGKITLASRIAESITAPDLGNT